jgi:hypothetical protein
MNVDANGVIIWDADGLKIKLTADQLIQYQVPLVPLSPGEVADLLDRAADLLEAEGWIQGSFHVEGVGRCAVGAIRDVAMNEYRWYQATNLLDLRVKEKFNHPCGLMNWNDEAARSAFEVIDLLRATAKDLRNEAVTA